jgi:zinc protease
VCAIENPIPAVEHELYTLSNGLTVILAERRGAPLVGVNVNYMVGAKNEKPGRTGFAHLFEHLMFQGSRHFDDDFFKALQDVGGSVNGGTNSDRTRYWELVPSAYLERALWLESDRMGFLLEAMTQERLDNQRSVVQNERRQSYENRPYGLVGEQMAAVLYPPDHPYHWTPIGSMEDIAAASLDDVRAFFRAYYAPSNASLCLAGDFQSADAKELVEQYFGGLPPGPPVARLERWVPRLASEVALRIEDRVELPRTYVAWHTVPLYAADDVELDAFAQILGQGKTSRLYQRLVYELQIAQDALAVHASQQIAGTFQIVVTPRPGHRLENVEEAAFAVLREALEEGVTPAELERVQTTTTAQFVRSLQSVGGFGGLSDRLNEYFHYLTRPDMVHWDLQRTLGLTPAAVKDAARRYLGSARVVARIEPLPPLAPSTSPAALSVRREAMPGPSRAGTFSLPARQRFTLPNGLGVVLAEHHALPLLSCGLLLRGGTAADPPGRFGLVSLTATLLSEGAAGKSSREIAEALETIGAQFEVTASSDAATGGLFTLADRAPEAFAILADVVCRPDFPAEELERQRARRLVRLRQLRDDAPYLATVSMQRVLYREHPYAHPTLGVPEALQAIGRDELVAFWRRTIVPSNATLVVVGDTTRGELEELLAATLGAWGPAPPPRLELPPAPHHPRRTIYLVDRPGAAQSVVSAGLMAVPRSAPGHAAREVLSAAFGGQFVSRLNLNLREAKGFTYGARSRFTPRVAAGTFTATASVQTGVTAATVREIVLELEALAENRPLSDAEVAYAAASLANGYRRRFETTAQVARELLTAALYGLPDADLERFPDEVLAVTAEEVAGVVRDIVLPDCLALVVVGDREVVRADLEALSLGPLVELGPEGAPVTREP